MRLLSFSYTNIGPFADRTMIVNCRNTNVLIKAPIGTGKSFLFFDGPRFLLRGKKDRSMLSRLSNKGSMECLVEHDDIIIYIVKTLTRTKSGNDSVATQALIVDHDFDALYSQLGGYYHDIVQSGQGLSVFLNDHEIILSPIVAKNKSDVEQSIADLLPPESVMTSVSLLMQSNNDIFTMTPIERIGVFKHLFNLLSIDEIKDMISERKRDLMSRQKIVSDTGLLRTEWMRYLQSLKQCMQSIQRVDLFNPVIEHHWWQDIITRGDHSNLDTTIIDDQRNVLLSNTISMYDNSITTLTQQRHGLISQQSEVTKKQQSITQSQQQISNLQQQYDSIGKKIPAVQTISLNHLLEQKDRIMKQRDTIVVGLELSRFQQYDSTIVDGVSAYHRVQAIKKQAQSYKETQQLLEQSCERAKEQLQQLDQQIVGLRNQLNTIDTTLSDQTNFHCDKIGHYCPYIHAIKGASLKPLQLQRESIVSQISQLDTDTRELYISRLQSTIQQQQQVNDSIMNLRKQLMNLPWQLVEQQYPIIIGLNDEISRIDQEITAANSVQMQLRGWIQEQQTITGQIQQITTDLQILQQQYDQLLVSIDASSISRIDEQLTILQSIKLPIQSLQTNLAQLQSVLDRNKSQQQQRYELERQLQIHKDLELVFSKELMLLVLQDFLPQLETTINSMLAKVVDFQLQRELCKTVSDKIELDISIIDEKGQRPVESLSGGQRIVLKLSWILAISTMMRGKFLWLDETINNMDAETIGRVAQLIDEFTKQRPTMFYLVTHSAQIQGLSFWQDVVELGEIK